MDIGVVFHGVPAGHDVWGSSTPEYYQGFYNLKDVCGQYDPVLVVETRRLGNDWCSYYSFIKAKNVCALPDPVTGNARTGSYFGMTLYMVGHYCTDVYSLFQLFGLVYDQKLFGKVLGKAGSGDLHFRVASFSAAESVLTDASQVIVNNVKTSLSSSIEEVDQSFVKDRADQSVFLSIDDTNSESFLNYTRHYGKVFVSPEYPTRDAIIESLTSKDKKSQSLILEYEQCKVRLSKAELEIQSLKLQYDELAKQYQKKESSLSQSQNTIASLKSNESALNQTIGNLKQQVSELEKSVGLGKVLEQVKAPIIELADKLRAPSFAQEIYKKKSPSHSHERTGFFDSPLIKYLGLGLLGLLLGALLGYFAWKGFVKNPQAPDKQMKALQEQVEKLTSQRDQMEKELAEIKENKGSLPCFPDAWVDFDASPIQDCITLNKAYTVKIVEKKGSTNVFPHQQKGEWRIDAGDASITKQNGTDSIIQLTPTKTGPIVVSFYIGNNLIQKRALTVKDPNEN